MQMAMSQRIILTLLQIPISSYSYRHFDTDHIEPDYEFGFGLSYSEFRFSDLKLNENEITFTVENISDVDGEEVAQVYVEYPWDSWNSRPLHELRAFKKVPVPVRSMSAIPPEIFRSVLKKR